MTILVTGSTGNVGSQVVRTLSERGEDVRAVGRDLILDGGDRLFLACATVPEQVAFECEGFAMAHAKAAELRMAGYKDVVTSLRVEPPQAA